MSSNFDKYCKTPDKLACCLIERDVEEEDVRGLDEVIRMSVNVNGAYEDIGLFFGSWELEEWLWSDLPYEQWRRQKEEEDARSEAHGMS